MLSPSPFETRTDFSDPARNVFGKPGFSHPTPNLADFVLVEAFSLEKSQAEYLEKGTPHPTFNGQNGAALARLIDEKHAPGDNGKTNVTRFYATDRADQDAYNAAVSYTAQSIAHRVFARSYLTPRAGYQPTAKLTPDAADPLALLTQEQSQQAEAPYGNVYLRVTKVFENFGSRAEQDAWNQQGTTYPYLKNEYPKLVRRYRFPKNGTLPTLVCQETRDLQFPAAVLTDKNVTDESSCAQVLLCTFESFPDADEQTGLGVSVTRPYGTADFPLVMWKFRVDAADYVPAQDYAPCPIPGYAELVLTNEATAPADDNPAALTITREYRTLPGPEVYRTEKTKLPRQLTPIPGYFLNDVPLTTITQDVYPDTEPDAIDSTISLPDGSLVRVLSATIEEQTKLVAQRVVICRPDENLPTVLSLELARAADGAVATSVQRVLDNVSAGVPPTLTLSFGDLAAEDTPLSPNQTLRRVLHVASFPLLSGAYQNRPSEQYPGEFGDGSEATTTLYSQLVAKGGGPTLASWNAAHPTNLANILEIENVDERTDRVILRRRDDGGSGSYVTQRITPWGTSTITHALGGSVSAGLGVISSETRRVGGQTAATTEQVNPQPLHDALYESGVPEEFYAGFVTQTTRSLVAAGTAPDSTALVLRSSVTGEDQSNSRKETLALPNGAVLPALEAIEEDPDADGEQSVTAREIVDWGAEIDPPLDYKTLSFRDQPIQGGLRAIRTHRRLDAEGFPELRGEFIDEATGGKVIVLRQIVDAAASDPPSVGWSTDVATTTATLTPYGFIATTGGAGSASDYAETVELRPKSKRQSYKVTTRHYLPPTTREVTSIPHSFPRRLNYYHYSDANGVSESIAGGDNRMVGAVVETSWSIGPKSIELFSPKTVTINYPGFRVSDVLLPESINGDTYEGAYNGESFSLPLPASDPTVEDYEALVSAGAYHCIKGESKPYWKDLYRTVLLLVRLQ